MAKIRELHHRGPHVRRSIKKIIAQRPLIGRPVRIRTLSQEADRVRSGIYLGNGSAAHMVTQDDFDRIYSVAENFEVSATTHSFELSPHHTEQKDEFASAVESVREAIRSKDRFLIHCHEGKERAPTVLGAAIAAEEKRRFDEVINEIRKSRPIVEPTPQLEQLASGYLEV